MPDVFVNYRTGDGDEVAVLVANALTHRFGDEAVFRDARSIPPGEPFPSRLLSAVHESAVLLAIMGPEWPHHPRLRDPHDWVRREIIEAYASGTRIIPVLKGRKTERLNPADLPEELARMADLQYVRIDPASDGADLAHLGDLVADLVPWLTDTDRRTRPETAAGSGAPPAPQPGTRIFGTGGPVHTGTGDLNNGGQHFHGDGATYIGGDGHGGIGHRFGGSPAGEDTP